MTSVSNELEMEEDHYGGEEEIPTKESAPIIPDFSKDEQAEEILEMDEEEIVLDDAPNEPIFQEELSSSSESEEPTREDLPIITMPEENQSSTEQRAYYYVQAGDTLWNISKRFNISISQLVEWNNLKSNTIRLGMKLRVSNRT